MPPVVAAAAIGGAAALGGAALSSRSSGRATRSQTEATDKALAFERENETRRRLEYDEAQQMAKAQWQARENARLGLLRRYGINVPSGGGAPGTPPPASALTLGRLAAGPAEATPQLSNTGDWRSLMRPQGRTLGQLAQPWHTWGGR